MARDAVLIGKQDGKWLMLIAPDAPGGEAVQAYKQARGNDGVIGKDQFEEVRLYDGPVFQQFRRKAGRKDIEKAKAAEEKQRKAIEAAEAKKREADEKAKAERKAKTEAEAQAREAKMIADFKAKEAKPAKAAK
jgi:hypothetical protein